MIYNYYFRIVYKRYSAIQRQGIDTFLIHINKHKHQENKIPKYKKHKHQHSFQQGQHCLKLFSILPYNYL